jgi:hypothetical protein
LHWLGHRHLLSLTTHLSRYEDRTPERPPGYPPLGSTSRNYGLIWRTLFTPVHSASLEYSYYSSETAALDYRYSQFGATYSGRFWQRKLGLNLATYRRLGEGDLSRFQADLSADWEFYPKHMIRAAGSHYFNDSFQDEGLYRVFYVKRF